MRLFALLFGLVWVVGCGANPEVEVDVDHSEHMAGMDMESSDPVYNMSLYQLESGWTTQDNEDVVLNSLEGRFQVVAMTYTSCEVACPRIVASMKKIQKDVDSDRVGFVLVSIDPARDTPATLHAYAEKMDLDRADWTLLTGRSDDVLELAALLGVRYKSMPDGDFAHSNIVSVLDESGSLMYQQNGLGPDLTESTIEYVQASLKK